jgi:hypothetical protein
MFDEFILSESQANSKACSVTRPMYAIVRRHADENIEYSVRVTPKKIKIVEWHIHSKLRNLSSLVPISDKIYKRHSL